MSVETDSEEMEYSEVRDLLSRVSGRNVGYVEMEGSHLILTFTLARDTWRYEVSLDRGNQWLHKRTDGEYVTVWEAKQRY